MFKFLTKALINLGIILTGFTHNKNIKYENVWPVCYNSDKIEIYLFLKYHWCIVKYKQTSYYKLDST